MIFTSDPIIGNCSGSSWVGLHPFFEHNPLYEARYEWCDQCPAMWQCFLAAMPEHSVTGSHEPGVWGGMTEDERREFGRKFPNLNTTRAKRAFERHRRELNRRARGWRAVRDYDARRKEKKPCQT